MHPGGWAQATGSDEGTGLPKFSQGLGLTHVSNASENQGKLLQSSFWEQWMERKGLGTVETG